MFISPSKCNPFYQNTYPLLVEYELSKVDFYLDINHYDKLPEIYGYVTQNQLPLLTFENTQAPNQSYQAIFHMKILN